MRLVHSGPVLVTGVAGFIGYHVAERLLGEGCRVVGLDNLSPYNDVRAKEARLARLRSRSGFRFVRLGLADQDRMDRAYERNGLQVFDRAGEAVDAGEGGCGLQNRPDRAVLPEGI